MLRPGYFAPGNDPVFIALDGGCAQEPVYKGAEYLPQRDSIPGPSSP
jgi:hypothetical protein